MSVFQAMNHPNVSVLDGGLPRYQAEGYELDTEALSSEAEGAKRAHVETKVCARGSLTLTFKLS